MPKDQAQLSKPASSAAPMDQLFRRLEDGTARVGILGLGYVGLPLAVAFADAFPVTGFDPNVNKVRTVNAGRSHIMDVSDEQLRPSVANGRLIADSDFSHLTTCDVIVICVPTPLERDKAPDLSYVETAAQAVASHLRPGQLVVLESTTYPGTTEEFILPMLRQRGFELDREFLLAFSPERIDPGNTEYALVDIPKVVGGCSQLSTDAACTLYGTIMRYVHPVSSARAAETTKLLENTFRSVNIALANEFAMLCTQLGIDASEVIEAAATKPFGFMPFYPGPGVGGHCIPLDPLYLSWRAKQQGFVSRFITLADEVNSGMPEHVVDIVSDALNQSGKPLRDAHVLILGVAYKDNIDDVRHSPAIPIIDRLRAKGAKVSYHDPHVPHLDIDMNEWPEWRPRRDLKFGDRRRRLKDVSNLSRGRRRFDELDSVDLSEAALSEADITVVVTNHTSVDYERVARCAQLIVDTRFALSPQQRELAGNKVVPI